MKLHLGLALLVALGASPAAAQLVVLDPGHGGADPGAVGCAGLEEAPTVLDVGQRAQGLLEASGLRVEMTREDDRAVGLSARASFANSLGADLYVSVHSNSNGGTPATGTETFIANSASSTSVRMAGYLQEEMIAAWGLRDRGVKRADFTVIATTRMPAALTEIAFTNRCDPDAMLLRDAGQRMRMAEAHARAVLRTLGRDPSGLGTGGTTGTGVLRGVVFEDVGVGLEDTSRRLDRATVRVGEQTMNSAAETGAFSFDVAPGTHTVEVSRAGFEMASRTCEVTRGGETWCSVGLARVDAPPPPPEDAGVTPEDDAGPPDVPDAGAAPARDAGPPPPGRTPTSAGCAATPTLPRGGALPLLLVALLALALRRPRIRRSPARSLDGIGGKAAEGRARLWATTLGLSLLLAACSPTDRAATRAPLEELAPSPASAPLAAAHVSTPLAVLTAERPVAEALTAPVLSPDGRHVAMSNADRTELWLADLEAGTLEAIAQGHRVGYRPVFEGAELRYRHPEQSPTAVPHYTVDLPNDVGAAPDHGLRVQLDERHRVVLHQQGRARVISPEGDRYLEPSVSTDGRHVVYWGMVTGIHLYRVDDGARVEVGDGGHPQLSPDGRWLVFDRTTDEGHVLTGGELYLTDLRDPAYRTGPITDSPHRIEQMPSIAGDTIVFATEEGVIAATLSR